MSEKITKQSASATRLGGAAMSADHFGGAVDAVDGAGKLWLKLIKYSKKHLPLIIVALVLTVVGNVLEVSAPGRMSALTNVIRDGLSGTIDMAAVQSLVITLAALFIGAAFLSFLQNFIMATMTARVSQSMRSDLSGKINRLPLKYFDRVSLGDVMSRVTNDVDTIGQTLNQNIGILISAVTMFFGSLTMMFVTNWLLALVAIGTSLLGLLVSRAVLKWSKKYFKAQQQGIGAVNGHVEEVFSGLSVVKANNAGKAAKGAFTKINSKLCDAAWKAQFVSGFITPLMNFSGVIGYVAVCVVGALLAMQGSITFGVIVAFILYIEQFTLALTHIAETVPGLQSTAAASERVFEFLDEEELSDESGKTGAIADTSGNVAFQNVHFGYNADKIIIHDFSAQVRAGQKIAIVGPTGAGKTTIVNLLMRFYELDGGDILIGGTPTTQVKRAQVHDQFSMVLQDTWLFDGTIKENIVFSKQGVTDEQVESACQAVGLMPYINTLPDRFDTPLSGAASLSEGQKQLINIARAMIQDAPMLILDEATSSVDTRTEVLIQLAMDKLMTGRTSFVIAHRLSTIKNADLILVMKDGDIIESGKHEDLLAQKGFYADLYNSQFELAGEATA